MILCTFHSSHISILSWYLWGVRYYSPNCLSSNPWNSFWISAATVHERHWVSNCKRFSGARIFYSHIKYSGAVCWIWLKTKFLFCKCGKISHLMVTLEFWQIHNYESRDMNMKHILAENILWTMHSEKAIKAIKSQHPLLFVS